VFVFGHGGLTLASAALLWRRRWGPPPWESMKGFFLLLVFALLPDLLDKPLTLVLLPEAPSTRWAGHTLLLWIISSLVVKRIRPAWSPYIWASLFHLALDRMWTSPHTLFFPLLGWKFDPSDSAEMDFWKFLVHNLQAYGGHWNLLIPELAGLGTLVYAFARLRSGRLRAKKHFLVNSPKLTLKSRSLEKPFLWSRGPNRHLKPPGETSVEADLHEGSL